MQEIDITTDMRSTKPNNMGKRVMRKSKWVSVLLLVVTASTITVTTPAVAQNAANMTCDDLWYARNQIYAQNGFCFKTAKAKSVFGTGCFPPYGKFGKADQLRVNELQFWERQKGCP